jgi:hypothetical protein
MIVMRSLGNDYFVIRDHVKHKHTDKFVLIKIENGEPTTKSEPKNTVEEAVEYCWNYPLSDGMS